MPDFGSQVEIKGEDSPPQAVTTYGITLQRKAHVGRPTVTFKTTPTEIFEYNIEDNIEHMMALGYLCRFNYLIKNPGTITDRVFGNSDNVSKLVLTTDELLASDKYIQMYKGLAWLFW